MKIRWLLDMLSVEDYNNELEDVIHDLGDYYYRMDPFWYLKNGSAELVNNFDNGPVMSLCSLGAAQFILNRTKVSPGAYCNLQKFKVSNYSKDYYNYMLNDYLYMPLWQLSKNKTKLFETFGNNGAIFVRPDSGFKTFNGMILTEERFNNDLEDISKVTINPYELVCISEPKNINREWRLVIVEDKVVGASQYKNSGKLEILTNCPQSIKDFAETASSTCDNPDKCYVMDIAETIFGPKIIELNSFSCSGLYKCNIKEVISAVREVVIQDFKDSEVLF